MHRFNRLIGPQREKDVGKGLNLILFFQIWKLTEGAWLRCSKYQMTMVHPTTQELTTNKKNPAHWVCFYIHPAQFYISVLVMDWYIF